MRTPSVALAAVAVALSTMSETAAQSSVARILIYSATRDFRHDSIPTAVDALVAQGPAANITFDHTEDQTWFTDDRLQQYDALVFLSNTGEGEWVRICGAVRGSSQRAQLSSGRRWQGCVPEILGPGRELHRDPLCV